MTSAYKRIKALTGLENKGDIGGSDILRKSRHINGKLAKKIKLGVKRSVEKLREKKITIQDTRGIRSSFKGAQRTDLSSNTKGRKRSSGNHKVG